MQANGKDAKRICFIRKKAKTLSSSSEARNSSSLACCLQKKKKKGGGKDGNNGERNCALNIKETPETPFGEGWEHFGAVQPAQRQTSKGIRLLFSPLCCTQNGSGKEKGEEKAHTSHLLSEPTNICSGQAHK